MHGLTAFETGCRLTGGQQPWHRSTVIQPVCPVLAPPVAGLRRHSSDSCNSVETQLVSDAMRSAPWPELKVKTGEREPSLPHSGVLLGMARSNSKPITHRSGSGCVGAYIIMPRGSVTNKLGYMTSLPASCHRSTTLECLHQASITYRPRKVVNKNCSPACTTGRASKGDHRAALLLLTMCSHYRTVCT